MYDACSDLRIFTTFAISSGLTNLLAGIFLCAFSNRILYLIFSLLLFDKNKLFNLSVKTPPGATILEVMLYCAYSKQIDLVKTARPLDNS